MAQDELSFSGAVLAEFLRINNMSRTHGHVPEKDRQTVPQR